MRPYVVLDLETTGLDPHRDAIIQIAMRRSDGSEWSSFVNPGRPVPPAIRQLTGFESVNFDEAPPFEELIPTVAEWLSGSRLVGHNIRFDLGFLARYGLYADNALDTLEWSRLAFPLRSHHALADWFPDPDDALHDARHDVRVTETLLKRIGQQLGSFSPNLQRDLRFFLGDEWAWWDLGLQPDGEHGSPLYSPAPDLYQPEPLLAEDVPGDPVAWLEQGGTLAGAVEGFQVRPGQLAMARGVASALANGEILMVEAGTGTGKSLAYLTPTMARALAAGERVVVATHTVALQDQLWSKDLPQASRDLAVRTALVKGRGRYLCLYKAAEVVQQSGVMGESRERRWAIAQMLAYIEATDVGDAEEFPVKSDIGRTLWGEVMADSQACAGARCPYAGPCFMRRARHVAESSHLVVVNHALLAAHIANGNILPPFSHLVVDEAHHLSEVLERALGFDLDLEHFHRRFREVMHPRTGLWSRLQVHPELLGTVHNIQDRYQRVRDAIGALGQSLVGHTPPGEYDRRSVRLTAARCDLLSENGFFEQLDHVNQFLHELVDQTELLWQESEARGTAVDTAPWLRYRQWQQDLVNLAMGLTLWGKLSEDRVSWWEVHTGRDGEPQVNWRWAPVEIAQILEDNLWASVDSAVLTSATLTVRGKFDYVAETLGVPRDRLHSLNVGSPFDWPAQARLLIPTDSPDPGDSQYLEALSQLIISVAQARRGHTLVLLTSYRAVEGISWRIREALAAYDIRTLAQGIDGPGRRLVQDFRHDPRAVLLGTMTYWEGVDIPGSDLEVVIMGRLPFRAPGDPLEEAKQERIERRGQSPFYRRSLPEAVLRFQQGFGRLIRTTTDRGVVIVFDPRIQPGRTRYANLFLGALSGVPRVMGRQEELLTTIEEFWGSGHAHLHQQ
ncbi:MAG: exonuclease domain-containing protein [Firmicutes bacterium]|nr:exonuclease domain-containing protein [Bacillota bacterium]